LNIFLALLSPDIIIYVYSTRVRGRQEVDRTALDTNDLYPSNNLQEMELIGFFEKILLSTEYQSSPCSQAGGWEGGDRCEKILLFKRLLLMLPKLAIIY